MSEPNTDDQDALVEEILDKGEVVFAHGNDISVLPGSGARCVYRWQGKFAVEHPDLGFAGPYETFDEALHAFDDDLLTVTYGTGEIRCSLLTSQELLELIELNADEVEILINGEPWHLQDNDYDDEDDSDEE